MGETAWERREQVAQAPGGRRAGVCAIAGARVQGGRDDAERQDTGRVAEDPGGAAAELPDAVDPGGPEEGGAGSAGRRGTGEEEKSAAAILSTSPPCGPMSGALPPGARGEIR